MSADRVITRDPVELAAVMLSGAAMSCLVGGMAKAEELGQNFVNTRDAVAACMEQNAVPFVAKVYRPSPLSSMGMPGSVKLVMDYTGWMASRRSEGFRP